MPPKKVDKKAGVKKADKIIEDKTFGLKNKNKSKKVQQYVTHITAQAKQQVGLKHQTEAEKLAALRAKKEAKDREDEELKMLFSQMQTGAGKRAKAMEAAEEAAKQKREAEGEDGAPAVWVDQDMTGKPIEDVIEYERAKLAFHKLNTTPVTEESFAKWKKDKAEKIKKENAEKVAREMAKKAKGKGLSVLSGKALFEYDASLFIDDEEAGTEAYDMTQLKGLMEEEEEEKKEDDGEEEGVAVQESLYEEDDDDLDDLDDEEEEEEEEARGVGGQAGGGGGKKGGGVIAAEGGEGGGGGGGGGGGPGVPHEAWASQDGP